MTSGHGPTLIYPITMNQTEIRFFVSTMNAVEAAIPNNLGIADNYHLAWAKHFGAKDIKTSDKKLKGEWERLEK
jgi:predicted nucleic acid-binding protein